MSEKRLSGSIALTKLVHVIMKKKGKDGNEIEGIFIPIDLNKLQRGEVKEGAAPIYMNVSVTVRDESDKYGQHGYIGKQLDSKAYKALTDEEKAESKKWTPILGNIKNWEASASTADTSGAASEEVVDEDDDLPF